MVDLRALEVFFQVVKPSGFTRAADVLQASRLRLLAVERPLPPPSFTASFLETALCGLTTTIAEVARQVATGS